MKYKRIMTIGLVLIAVMLISSTTVNAKKPKGPPKPKIAQIDPQLTGFQAISSSGFSPPRAGMVFAISDVNIPGVGKSTVTIDGSWDWSSYSTSHPCALFDSAASPSLIELINTDFGPPVIFAFNVYNAAVTITDNKGDTIAAAITGGSVCEIVVFGPGDSINEWVVAFETDGVSSTGKYAGRTGTGHLVFRLSGATGANSFSDPRFIVLDLK